MAQARPRLEPKLSSLLQLSLLQVLVALLLRLLLCMSMLEVPAALLRQLALPVPLETLALLLL